MTRAHSLAGPLQHQEKIRKVLQPIQERFQTDRYLNWGIDKEIIRDIKRTRQKGGLPYKPEEEAGKRALEHLDVEIAIARSGLNNYFVDRGTSFNGDGLDNYVRAMQLTGGPFSSADGHSMVEVATDENGRYTINHPPGRLKRALAVFPLANLLGYLSGNILYQKFTLFDVDMDTILEPRDFGHWHQDLFDNVEAFRETAIAWGIGNFPWIFTVANVAGLGALAGWNHLRGRKIMRYRNEARESITEGYVESLSK
jgi:hypothetical protein